MRNSEARQKVNATEWSMRKRSRGKEERHDVRSSVCLSVWSKLLGAGDMFGDYLCAHFANLPSISGRNQFTDTKFSRPNTKILKSSLEINGEKRANGNAATTTASVSP